MCPPFLGAYSWIILFGNAGIVTKFLSNLFGFQMPSIYGQGGICAVFTLKLFPYVYLYVSGATAVWKNAPRISDRASCAGC